MGGWWFLFLLLFLFALTINIKNTDSSSRLPRRWWFLSKGLFNMFDTTFSSGIFFFVVEYCIFYLLEEIENEKIFLQCEQDLYFDSSISELADCYYS